MLLSPKREEKLRKSGTESFSSLNPLPSFSSGCLATWGQRPGPCSSSSSPLPGYVSRSSSSVCWPGVTAPCFGACGHFRLNNSSQLPPAPRQVLRAARLPAEQRGGTAEQVALGAAPCVAPVSARPAARGRYKRILFHSACASARAALVYKGAEENRER